MDAVTVRPSGAVRRDVTVPGDKSISHRALLFSAIADGGSRIRGLQPGLDVLATRRALDTLGVRVGEEGGVVTVAGRGLCGLREPGDVIDCANSGTTMRLLCGILAGQGFLSVLTGDRHLRRRPMARVLDPIRDMGALALGREEDTRAPLVIRGGSLRATTWRPPAASAQVKSAILLAGLYARGVTWVEEPVPTRDHTERMLACMGAELLHEPGRVGIRGGGTLAGQEFLVPGDPSSASFWVVAALVVPGSRVRIRDVCVNPTRTGLFSILQRMGASLRLEQTGDACGEPVGDVIVEHGPLRGVTVAPEEVPAAIDEFPILAVAAAFAEGSTEVRGAEELRHKESDRIDTVAGELRKAGVPVETFRDGMRVEGGADLNPARFESHGDHRLAMATGVLALGIGKECSVLGAGAADVSYPEFWAEILSG